MYKDVVKHIRIIHLVRRIIFLEVGFEIGQVSKQVDAVILLTISGFLMIDLSPFRLQTVLFCIKKSSINDITQF